MRTFSGKLPADRVNSISVRVPAPLHHVAVYSNAQSHLDTLLETYVQESLSTYIHVVWNTCS